MQMSGKRPPLPVKVESVTDKVPKLSMAPQSYESPSSPVKVASATLRVPRFSIPAAVLKSYPSSMVSPETVSYTHLDVYKRQGLCRLRK